MGQKAKTKSFGYCINCGLWRRLTRFGLCMKCIGKPMKWKKGKKIIKEWFKSTSKGV